MSRPGIYLVYTRYIPTSTPRYIPGIYLVYTSYMYSESLRYIPGIYLVDTLLLAFSICFVQLNRLAYSSGTPI